ncbi:MAG: NAD(P)-binding protein [Elusimicrobiota bacterium]|nr:NAD(P)-binding protein [Elusimicrobiota bacterium]
MEMQIGMKPVMAGALKDKRIAVISSGPAGLSCARELFKMGYKVAVFEMRKSIGGVIANEIPRRIACQTSNPKISAGGDIVNRGKTVVQAVGSAFHTAVPPSIMSNFSRFFSVLCPFSSLHFCNS